MTEVEIVPIAAADDMAPAFAIRREVFCREQGVAEELEIDGLDDQCRHYLMRVGGIPVGTARTRRLAAGEIKIERVAVLEPYRGRGLGRALMTRIVADIGRAPAVLNAQLRTADFYAGLGFVRDGDVFDDAGIPHIRMTLKPG